MLKTSEKVQAALQLVKSEGVGGGMSVSGFCKLAKINRSNLYEHHPDLLKLIKSVCKKPAAKQVSKNKSAASNSCELNELRVKYKALLRVALEQQAEILWLRKQVPAKRGRSVVC